MTTARVISEADIVPHRAAGYRLENGEVKNQEWVSPTLNTTADGALYFSVSDVIKWDAAVRARAILKPESWNRILQPVTLNSGKTWPYGFGWFLDERGGHPLQQHSGSWQGFKTQLSRFIGEDVSIIVLANLAEAKSGEIRRWYRRDHESQARRACPSSDRRSRTSGYFETHAPAGGCASRNARPC